MVKFKDSKDSRYENDKYSRDGKSLKGSLKSAFGDGKSLPSGFGQKVSSASNDALNFIGDAGANASNALGWLTGGPQRATGSQFNNFIQEKFGFGGSFRSPSRGGDDGRSRQGSFGDQSGTSRGGGGSRPNNKVRNQADENAKELGFADYLAMAQELGFGGTPDYSAMEKHLRDTASQGDARLNSMYTQLRGSIDADAPGIQQGYDSSRAAMEQNAASAQDQIGKGYSSAQSAQSQQMKDLGIEEAAAVLASNGGLAASDQGARAAGVETNRLANTQQSLANKQSAVSYNTGIGNAAGLEGQIQRANLQSKLAEQLAQLNMKQEEDSVASKGRLFEAAGFLQNQDTARASGQAESAEKAGQQAFDNDLAVQRLILDQMKAQGSGKTIEEALSNMGILQSAGQKVGVADDPEAFAQFIKNVKLSGGFN